MGDGEESCGRGPTSSRTPRGTTRSPYSGPTRGEGKETGNEESDRTTKSEQRGLGSTTVRELSLEPGKEENQVGVSDLLENGLVLKVLLEIRVLKVYT